MLPSDFYALAEQVAGDVGPDVLTLREPTREETTSEPDDSSGGLAVATAPAKVLATAQTEARYYTAKQRRLVIRHASGNRIVALLEIVSPGNKNSQRAFDSFLGKNAKKNEPQRRRGHRGNCKDKLATDPDG